MCPVSAGGCPSCHTPMELTPLRPALRPEPGRGPCPDPAPGLRIPGLSQAPPVQQASSDADAKASGRPSPGGQGGPARGRCWWQRPERTGAGVKARRDHRARPGVCPAGGQAVPVVLLRTGGQDGHKRHKDPEAGPAGRGMSRHCALSVKWPDPRRTDAGGGRGTGTGRGLTAPQGLPGRPRGAPALTLGDSGAASLLGS